MTIDEAIKQEREEAERNRKIISSGYDGEICIAQLYADDTEAINDVNDRCEQCAKYHEQLAEWLEELKVIKSDGFTDNLLDMGYTKGYRKAIDDFADKLSKYLDVENATKYGNKNAEQQINSYDTLMKYEIADAIDDVAEQLKEGGIDG